MSRLGNKIQEKFMAMKFRGKEIFKPLNTGRNLSCSNSQPYCNK